MQDRFRYRVWDKTQNKWLHFDFSTYPTYQDRIWQALTDGETFYQCTGLKDKNGKLIYEGDILYNPFSNYKYNVNFGKFTLNYTEPFSVNITGFYITYKENIKNEIDSLQMLDLNNIEVIGNVYENPELLEE